MSSRVPETGMSACTWVMLLTLSMLWGGSFFFFKVLGLSFPPFTVVLGRVGLAAICLNLLLIARRDPMPFDIRLWRAFLLMGLLNNVVPFSLIAFGETRIASGLASILNATTPIFTVMAAHLLTSDEKLNGSKMMGVAFGFGGVTILVGPGALAGVGHGSLIGECACLLAALSYAFAGIYGRRFKGVAPLKIATGQITASTIILIPVAAIIDKPWTLAAPSPASWGAFFGIALLSTALAYILYFRILAVAGATNLLLVTFLLPISALALGTLLLGESVTGTAIGGMACVGLGLAAIDGRIVRRVLRWRGTPARPADDDAN